MKRKILNILFALIFLIGFGILTYPIAANQWNVYRQNSLISTYRDAVDELSEEDYSNEWEKAKAFNSSITSNNIYADVFGEDNEEDRSRSEYWSVLNVAGDGVMGYISIPKIDVSLSIYHGTGDKDLQTAAGHLNGTALPIGGEGTHSIIAAHRGLPSARLFTDIDQLQIGDMFYIHILNETLAYKVDQILPMVAADDMDTLTEALAVEEGKDYISLFTCTPYGVNTHRLIVRGVRTEYIPEEEVPLTTVETMVEAVTDYYMLFLILGLAVTTLAILLLRFLFRRKKK